MAFVIGAYRLDDTQRVVYRDATIVPLTPKLVDTLAVLAEAEGAIVSREALIDRIWKDTAVTDSSLTQNVWLLRRALEQHGTPYIETIPRRGYRLIVPVRREGARVEDADHAPAPHHRLPRAVTSLVGSMYSGCVCIGSLPPGGITTSTSRMCALSTNTVFPAGRARTQSCAEVSAPNDINPTTTISIMLFTCHSSFTAPLDAAP